MTPTWHVNTGHQRRPQAVNAIGTPQPGAARQHRRTYYAAYAANLRSATPESTPESSWSWVKASLHSIYDRLCVRAALANPG